MVCWVTGINTAVHKRCQRCYYFPKRSLSLPESLSASLLLWSQSRPRGLHWGTQASATLKEYTGTPQVPVRPRDPVDLQYS